MENNKKDVAPLSELFLLLPEHKRIVQGESSRLGVNNETARLQRTAVVLAIALAILVTYLVFIIILLILSQKVQSLDVMAIVIEIALAVFIARLLFLVIRRYQCKQKLENVGILLPGSVIEAKADKGITLKGIKAVLRLRYEFTSLKGERIEREEAQLRDDLNELPKLGTPVAVLYADKDCYRIL